MFGEDFDDAFATFVVIDVVIYRDIGKSKELRLWRWPTVLRRWPSVSLPRDLKAFFLFCWSPLYFLHFLPFYPPKFDRFYFISSVRLAFSFVCLAWPASIRPQSFTILFECFCSKFRIYFRLFLLLFLVFYRVSWRVAAVDRLGPRRSYNRSSHLDVSFRSLLSYFWKVIRGQKIS